MANVYDPFHDHLHAKEVEVTALAIYEQLPPETQKLADRDIIKVLAVVHDTSREVIGTNLFLEPLLGGYVSGWIGYRLMTEAGFSEKEALYVRGILRNHESFLGLWQYPLDINEKILADADGVEQYSLKRLQRAMRYFKQRKFSNILFNMYVFGLILSRIFITPVFHFESAKQLEKENLRKIKMYINAKRKLFGSLLYHRVYKLLYSKLISS
jgi:predicted Zn-dependent protease with MMP-like domain